MKCEKITEIHIQNNECMLLLKVFNPQGMSFTDNKEDSILSTH